MRRQAEAPRHPRYRILRKLGAGGSGSVYLAEDLLDDGRRVALKIGRARLASGELRGEFRVLRELRHPGIARSFDFGRIPSSSLPYFTLEHIAGPDLEEESARLRGRGSPEDFSRIGGIFLDVIDALAYLHGKKLLHLDLKPSNVVFSGDRPKLIDFGLYQSFEMEGRRFFRGTAYYASPEVFSGAPLDARSDLYSLGVMLYRCFTGRHPIRGRTLEEVAENHRTAAPHPPRGVPEKLERIILKLLAKSPDRRFQDAAEARAALREALSGARRASDATRRVELEWVNRRAELARAFAWLDGVGRGDTAGVLLVEGDAGMGKSRFIEACATEALSAGFRVIPLRLTAGEDTNWLRRLIEKALVLDLVRSSEEVRHRFLFTSLGISSDPASAREIAELSLEQTRGRVFRDALDLLGARTQPPLLVSIDDFHLAGPELVDFVKRLWKSPESATPSIRLGVLAASRQGAEDLGLPVDPPPRGALSVRLAPLDKRDAREALLGIEGLGPAEATALVRASRGVPGRLADAAAELRMGRFRPGTRAAPAPWSLPAGLSRAALDLYVHAALLERPAPRSFIEEVLGLPPRERDAAASSLEGAGLVREDAAGRLQVVHEAAAGRLRAALEPERIERAHAAIGTRLLALPGRRREAALHLLRGGRTREGIRTALDVGRELKTTGRVEEALHLFEEAASRASSPADRRRLLEECGELREKLGQFDEAAASYRAILEEAQVEPALAAPDRLRILRRLGGVEQRRGNNETARKIFSEALEVMDPTQSVGERLNLFNEISALHLFLGDFSKAATFANRGLELLNTCEAAALNPEERAYHALNLHSASGHILLRQFEYDRALKEFRRGLELSERVGSMSNTALILNNLGIAYHQSNRLSSALRVYARAAALARRMGDGTATFSILCNLAMIRARLGEIRASEDLLREIEGMPQAAQSSRCRLFFLYSRGLTERIRLADSAETWQESIRLADALPDPLLARYGRMYLFENEVHQGRWKSARRLGSALASISAGGDARFAASVHVRLAWFEASTGNAAAARGLLRESKTIREKPGCNDLWDAVYQAAALVELEEIPAAARMLEETKSVFETSKQIPAAMECAMRLADAALRRRDSEAAAAAIGEARRLLELHDASTGSRAGRAWMPFLDARQALLSGRTPPSHAADRLADAAAGLGHGSTSEICWLLDLTAAACGVPGAERRLAASRSRFAAGLDPRDRKAYLARDHEVRLGLREPRLAPEEMARTREDLPRKRYEALASLRKTSDLREALAIALRGVPARRGAIFLDAGTGAGAAQGFRRGEKRLGKLREAALRAGTGRVGTGVAAEIAGGGRQRAGVLFVDPAGSPFDPGLEEFLESAGRMLAASLPQDLSAPRKPRPGPLRDRSERLLETREALRTRALDGPVLLDPASTRMREVMTLIHRTRDSRLPVLIVGESGTGKDFLAQQIHLSSTRAKGPFVAQDCSAIPIDLIEAEIFGYEEGAFTGADRSRTGYLFTADSGTFYLDNVDSMPLDVQVKLLRVLEEGGARPLGGRKERKLDVRFIASSQRELRDLCEGGAFRKDLYFRLSGITIHVPPLRERAEDLPRLLQEFQRQLPSKPMTFTPGALDALKSHSWPGNVRELESAVRRLALTCEGSVDEAAVGRILGVDGSTPSFPRWVFEGRSYRQAIDDLKREYLLWLFEKHEGNMDRVAAELGLSKRNVYVRFSQAGIRPVDLRRA